VGLLMVGKLGNSFKGIEELGSFQGFDYMNFLG
jgi:hypothetical protein